jgi:hypothetical protein
MCWTRGQKGMAYKRQVKNFKKNPETLSSQKGCPYCSTTYLGIPPLIFFGHKFVTFKLPFTNAC